MLDLKYKAFYREWNSMQSETLSSKGYGNTVSYQILLFSINYLKNLFQRNRITNQWYWQNIEGAQRFILV